MTSICSMGYQVQTDEAGHEFSLTDPRQHGYPGRSQTPKLCREPRERLQIADSNLKEIIDAAKLSKTNIIAVSDHGMSPLHTQGFPNRILRSVGLLSVTSSGAVDATTSQTNAVTVGGAANIYINLQGREPTGIVPPEQYEELQKQIENAFKVINDPVYQRTRIRDHSKETQGRRHAGQEILFRRQRRQKIAWERAGFPRLR